MAPDDRGFKMGWMRRCRKIQHHAMVAQGRGISGQAQENLHGARSPCEEPTGYFTTCHINLNFISFVIFKLFIFYIFYINLNNDFLLRSRLSGLCNLFASDKVPLSYNCDNILTPGWLYSDRYTGLGSPTEFNPQKPRPWVNSHWPAFL